MGPLRRIGRGERLQLVAGILLCLGLVTWVRSHSATSCPWSLAPFGGTATHLSHWAWGVPDGGGGRCFPSSQAAVGFAFLPGYFVFRRHAPRVARAWLACALSMGLCLGFAQQVRGAQFMSHTLWTGWLCWTAAWLGDLAAAAWRRRGPAGVASLPDIPHLSS